MPDSSSGSGGSTSSGGDGALPCSPNGVTCAASVAQICNNGTLTTTDCSKLNPAEQCANGYGCVVCVPGTGSCNGNVGTSCNSTGTGTVTNNCDPVQGESCQAATGQCSGDCASVGASYIGCEYYAVTMANSLLDQATFVFSVSIANAASQTANINIQGGALGAPMTGSIAPGAIQGFVLPWVPALSTSVATTVQTNGAYHIRSTEPITVYQFNARDYCVPSPSCTTTANGSTYSYTNDASLLLPVNAMTGNYRLMGAPTWESLGGGQYPGTVVVVGTASGTSVTVTPPGADFQAGAGMGASGGTVTLGAGDVLQIATVLNAPGTGTYGSDPSGALIAANQPVEVFGGADCIYNPASVQACDHVEQINFPIETLGKDYLVTVPHNDNTTTTSSKEYVKIVGTAANTSLVYDGITGKPATVGAGGVVYFETTTPFRITSSNPIEIGEYMEGQEAFDSATCLVSSPGGQTCGDPALSLAVATAQFRNQYPFTSPPNYYQNWVNVVAKAGSTVTITDQPSNHTVSSGTAIGTSGYYVANVPLCANNLSGCTGNHLATGTVPFGIKVYGYGSATSYMYPGGLNLNRQ
jgi:hypothetical protein